MLLEVKNISVSFKKGKQNRLFGKEYQSVLRNINISMEYNDILGVVGESGSGKSTFAKVILGMISPQSGDVIFEGKSILEKKNRSKMSIVFQDYKASVNPKFTIKQIIEEPLRLRNSKYLTRKDRNMKTEELMKEVDLPLDMLARYPHQLSGGQLQRVCIARAVATNPKLIVFDEATSSLDIKTQISILDLLIALKKKYGISYIFISHDLEAVSYICNKVAIFNEGSVVEFFPTIKALEKPKNKFSSHLLEAGRTLNKEIIMGG